MYAGGAGIEEATVSKSPPPRLVKESLVAAKCKLDLLRGGGAYSVVRSGGERKKKCRLPHGQNESSKVEHRALVTDCITED